MLSLFLTYHLDSSLFLFIISCTFLSILNRIFHPFRWFIQRFRCRQWDSAGRWLDSGHWGSSQLLLPSSQRDGFSGIQERKWFVFYSVFLTDTEFYIPSVCSNPILQIFSPFLYNATGSHSITSAQSRIGLHKVTHKCTHVVKHMHTLIHRGPCREISHFPTWSAGPVFSLVEGH